MVKKNPLAEIFGFPIDNLSAEANRYRKNKLCPYNNKVPSCTKDKANDPLGVCSVFDKDDIAITCPVRFRENWLIAEDAANFFFPQNTMWTSLTEVRGINMYQFGLFEEKNAIYNNIVNVASVQQLSPFRYPGGKTWLIPQIYKRYECNL